MSATKPLLAGRKGPRGQKQEAGRERTSKHTQMWAAGQHGGERDLPGGPPAIPPQKAALRSCHPARQLRTSPRLR